jgi:hypothetical protein
LFCLAGSFIRFTAKFSVVQQSNLKAPQKSSGNRSAETKLGTKNPGQTARGWRHDPEKLGWFMASG